ncbi:MAG: proton-conducting transporter membrane subunit [Anaerolineae bacterium]|nr:proton-conducting transporter membrane subunit [Anaerolineae bacterium]
MPAALWLIALPLGLAPLVFILRRKLAGAFLAAFGAVFVTWLIMQVPTGAALNVLGRAVQLDQLARMILMLLFAATSVLFLTLALSAFTDQSQYLGVAHKRSIGQEARIFYPAALVILALFVAAGLSRHLGITAIFIELAAIIAVFVIQTERLESTRAALRFLVLITLATPVFLLAAWRIDLYQLSGGLPSARDLEQTALFISIGFAIWLAVVPFQGWLTSTATEASAPMAAFVLISFPTVAVATLIHLLVDLPWLVDSVFLVNAMVIAGIFTAFIGGVMASVQRGLSELLGFAALFNLGCIVALIGIGGQAAMVTVVVTLSVRALALLLIAASMLTLHLLVSSDGFVQIRGTAFRMPVAIVGLLIGGLTLAGVPLTAGFAPYWQLLRTVAEFDSRWLIPLVLGSLGVATGYVRGLRAAMSSEPGGGDRAAARSLPKVAEPLPLLIIIILLGLLSLLLGFNPSLLIDSLQTVSAGITFPIR